MASFCLDKYKPMLAMVASQCIYAVMNLISKAAFNHGLSTLVFVVYRQCFGTLFMFPAVLLAKGGRISELSLNLKGFGLVFLASLAGATMNQALYYQGLLLGSPSLASAMSNNLIPAITFVMSASVGLEKVKLRSLRSWAKIVGTIVGGGGAMIMAFFKGPKLLNMSSQNLMDKWVLGGLCLMASGSLWSFWLILQVPICKSYCDALSLSAWTCLMSALQSAALTYYVHPGWSVWRLTSLSDLLAVLYAGSFGSAVVYSLQSWCISVRGPLYSAMFTPLSTVITTLLSVTFLHEQLHIGSLVGATAIIGGLYVVLWGKAEDLRKIEEEKLEDNANSSISIENPSNIQQSLLVK